MFWDSVDWADVADSSDAYQWYSAMVRAHCPDKCLLPNTDGIIFRYLVSYQQGMSDQGFQEHADSLFGPFILLQYC